MNTPVPRAPRFEVDHAAIDAALPPLTGLADCPQDPIHHAEGDVAIHTRMVLESLATIPAWRALPEAERETVFLGAALHDIGKPACTKIEDGGRVTSRGHSRAGERDARTFLYRAGFDPARREQVAGLIRCHQLPFLLLEREDLRRTAFKLSQSVRCDHLALVAEADIRGRTCSDAQRILDATALFVEFCREQQCLDRPRAFASDVSRVEYFRRPGRDPDYAAWDETRVQVVLLSGLPGVGKDTWLRAHAAGLPVVALDAIRRELDVDPADWQGHVIATAKERAKEHLRAARPFAINATNVSREIRGRWLELLFDYRARVRLVHVETPWEEITRCNDTRPAPVPPDVLDTLVENWEPPDATEAHSVEHVRGGS